MVAAWRLNIGPAEYVQTLQISNRQSSTSGSAYKPCNIPYFMQPIAQQLLACIMTLASMLESSCKAFVG